MLLKVGELARRCGQTVRTLHHYHQIGLLEPSARSDAGYRLYTTEDVQRLYLIVALRRLGLGLAEIGTALSDPQLRLDAVIDTQIKAIDTAIRQQQQLQRQLQLLRDDLRTGQPLDPARWLDTLELMTMYEKYFSPEELQNLPLYHDPDVKAQWQQLVSEMQQAMDRGARADDPQAITLARRWMEMIGRDTHHNGDLLMRLHTMNQQEPEARRQSGISEALGAFVEQAVIESRLAIFARYLDAAEMQRLRLHYGPQMYEWPPLITALRREMNAGSAPDAEPVRQLATRWAQLFRAYAGDDPATHARFRDAYDREPSLRGGIMDDNLVAYVRAALAALRPPTVSQ